MATTTYTVTCLSPVHAGSGKRWTKFDGAYEGQRWHVIDLDRVLARGIDAVVLTAEMSTRDFSWSDYLRRNRLAAPEMSAYSLPCADNPSAVPVYEALKNIDLQPYLTGSSLKGAIRTALLWRLMQELPATEWLDRLGKKREWLAQPLERAVLGKTPNHDLLRTLHVSDSSVVERQFLSVGLAWTYTLRDGRLVEKRERNSEFKVYVEWLSPGARLTVSIHLDEYLFQPAADARLHFSGPREKAIRELAATCNGRAKALIQAERAFFAAHQLSALQSFYADLEGTLAQLGPGSFFLNLGWGSGWEVKTVGELVRQALGQERWEQLREQFGLGRKPSTRQIDWQASFPKTRRVACYAGRAFAPLGWILLSPPGEDVPANPRWSVPAAPARPPRSLGAAVTVKILSRHEKGPPGSFFVQEEGQARGMLCHGTPQDPLPEVGASITVYVSSLDPRSPQYRWDPPPPPPDRGRRGRGFTPRKK